MYHRRIVLHTRARSLRCWLARRLLVRAGYSIEVVDAATDPGALAEICKVVGHEVAPPFMFVDDRPLGDLGTVRALAGSGQLEHLLRDDCRGRLPYSPEECVEQESSAPAHLRKE